MPSATSSAAASATVVMMSGSTERSATAQTAAAILGYNYQSSPFYDDTYRLLKGKGLSPEAKGDSWLTRIYRQMVKGEWL